MLAAARALSVFVFSPLLLKVIREGAVLPQIVGGPDSYHMLAVDVCSPPHSVLQYCVFYHWLICTFYQHRYTPAVIQSRFPTKMFSSLLSRTFEMLKIMQLSIEKCRNEYFSS